MIVAVVGKGRDCPFDTWAVAQRVGAAVALAGHVLLTGGLGGVMLAAAKGAAAEHGQVIGLVPDRGEPDPEFPGLLLRTGLSTPTRNVVMGHACDAMLACYGSHGTMQELAFALDRGIPVAAVACSTWHTIGVPTLELPEVLPWLVSLND